MRAMMLAAILTIALAGCATPDPGLPVIDRDFPDPDVISVDGVYWAYATNDASSNVQVATSTDLISWTERDDALPELPDWVVPGDTWAPEVTRVDDGFVLYFTAHDAGSDRQCIGVATSATPGGPFTAVDDGPIVCPADDGGAIDATTFVDDDGTRLLLYKNDGNCCRLDTVISAIRLTDDGLDTVGDPIPLIQQDQDWEGDLVEAPTLVKRDGTYVLFYSANFYAGPDYAIGYAIADDLAGPWVKPEQPWLTSDDTDFAIIGPGGQDVVGNHLVLHGWDDYLTYRGMFVVPLRWKGSTPIAPF